ncbi:hypothetical protein O9929_18615 [Vibrio lentus]|nr:hypothetical protein [Vibrio lentus]
MFEHIFYAVGISGARLVLVPDQVRQNDLVVTQMCRRQYWSSARQPSLLPGTLFLPT